MNGVRSSSYVPRLVQFTVAGDRVTFDWGLQHELGTAAFWTELARRRPAGNRDFRLGETLVEETTACLLGGYGVPAAVALAAFDNLRRELDLSAAPDADRIEAILRQPLEVNGHARSVRYRFPNQRAHRIARTLEVLASCDPPQRPSDLRDWLRTLPGIGPKTASWIVRNLTGSDEVAIIDIHIRRAGLAIGCFLHCWRLPRDYDKFEAAFLMLAREGDVPAGQLDATVWFELQRLGKLARLYGVDTSVAAA